ncbi:MAG: hypothetical protein K9G70_08925 [Prolixibacteraceae bacterium]|nr:hypothetical protein [Prolixibacteraceae bacterium]
MLKTYCLVVFVIIFITNTSCTTSEIERPNILWITIYASSGGHSNMRSDYGRSETLKFHAEILKELGYYCTNNKKTDYNTNVGGEIWDECSSNAHYKNAPEGKSWFAIFVEN